MENAEKRADLCMAAIGGHLPNCFQKVTEQIIQDQIKCKFLQDTSFEYTTMVNHHF